MNAELAKTLNFVARKKECERIERENMAFAKRLLEKQSEFSKQAMLNDFEKHIQYKHQMMKVRSVGYFLYFTHVL